MTLRQMNAWFYEGEGLKLLQEYYAKRFGTIAFIAGNSGTQMGGWFRKEIKTLEDLSKNAHRWTRRRSNETTGCV
ncbi:MAG: hypothetical protein RML84_00720 [Anaerolineae bacterium]|nr:hypothetical protein [Anaerolineae bacterium]